MRAASTYRGYRRNVCLRELKTTWGPRFYYEKHNRGAENLRAERPVRTNMREALHQLNAGIIKSVQEFRPTLRLRRAARGQ
jgi:hypothetical protein